MTVDVKNLGSGQFLRIDGGQVSTANILLAILVELRVQTQYLQAMNPQIADSLNSLRLDQVNDPASLITNTANTI